MYANKNIVNAGTVLVREVVSFVVEPLATVNLCWHDLTCTAV